MSRIPSPLEIPEPRNPDESRKPFRLNLELDASSFEWYSATRAVGSQSSKGYVHEVHTKSTFSPRHYKRALEEDAIRKTGLALSMADLSPSCKPGRSRRGTSTRSSTPVYNPETEDYLTPLMPGYLVGWDALSDSDSSDGADSASLFGSESGDFEYAGGSDDYSTGSDRQRVNAVTMVAGGAGYLAGSAVKAALVGVRSLVGWWSRRHTAS